MTREAEGLEIKGQEASNLHLTLRRNDMSENNVLNRVLTSIAMVIGISALAYAAGTPGDQLFESGLGSALITFSWLLRR